MHCMPRAGTAKGPPEFNFILVDLNGLCCHGLLSTYIALIHDFWPYNLLLEEVTETLNNPFCSCDIKRLYFQTFTSCLDEENCTVC